MLDFECGLNPKGEFIMNRRSFLKAAGAATLGAATIARAASAQPEKIRACVIGDSNRGGHGHGLHLVWQRHENVELVGLADPDEAGRTKHAGEAKPRRTYADYREMLAKEQPDLVAIGPRWTTLHKEYLLAAAEVGAHGIMEKPIATDLVEADAMVAAIENKNLKWSIGFNIRGTDQYQHTKRMILDEGIIGEVLEIRGRGKEDHRAGGEDLIVLGSHVLDLMIDLLGMPEWCAADIQANGKPATVDDVREPSEPIGLIVGDRIHATFGFPNGAYGHFDTMKNEGGNGGRFGLDIYGSKGIVTMRWGALPDVYVLHDPSWAPGGKDVAWEPLPEMPAPPEPFGLEERYLNITRDLLAAVEQDRLPEVSLQDGRNVQELIHAVFAAHANGGRVQLPLASRRHPLEVWRENA